VLLVALGGLMVTSVVYMLADSVVWLFVARGLQGIATGLALGAASAAMLDLHPRRDPAAVGLANGVVSAGGLGLGMLVSPRRSSCSRRRAWSRTSCCSRCSRSRSPARWRCPSRSARAGGRG
jgi:MFS family permease